MYNKTKAMFDINAIDPTLVTTAAKYFVAAGALGGVAVAPAWLAEKNKKDKLIVARVRASSWLFGWTVVGYLYGLYLAVASEKKYVNKKK